MVLVSARMFAATPLLVLVLALSLCSAVTDEVNSNRYEVYWNSTNPRFSGGEYTVEVTINDNLVIYCPHYEGAGSAERMEGAESAERMEQYVLYMVNYDGFMKCDYRRNGFKRWECNRPLNVNGPIRFSEKFQLFTPFSLGFEFRPGHEYYYISSSRLNFTEKGCLKLRVYVKANNDSVYESAESFVTDDISGGVPALPRLSLLFTLSLAILPVILLPLL
ncbi:ephrin-A2-like [Solea solea]|uniref:ephrin-A2-like n=1 Tax=Solea solea TaxID=90069 RepID=UPI00272AC939|nr:ephrin-A2-like [Solea solea]